MNRRTDRIRRRQIAAFFMITFTISFPLCFLFSSSVETQGPALGRDDHRLAQGAVNARIRTDNRYMKSFLKEGTVMLEKTNLLGAITAVAFFVSAILVFVFRAVGATHAVLRPDRLHAGMAGRGSPARLHPES